MGDGVSEINRGDGEGEQLSNTWYACMEKAQWNTFIQITYGKIKKQAK